VSISDVLASVGGTQAIYYRSGEDVVAFLAPWTQPHIVWSGQNGRIVAFSANARGDLVALLVSGKAGATEEGLSLVIVDASGSIIQRVANLGQIPNKNDITDGSGRLTWSPDGRQVVVAPPSGGLIAVPQSGDPVTLISSSRLPDPGSVVWSPRGDALAFVAPATHGQAGALYVATTAALPLDPIAVVPASLNGRRTISSVAWRPDGEALYYTVASTTNDPTFGGDLFEIPAGGGAPKLVATASRVGPVSAITDFAISPDGRGVAYVVTVPRDDGGFTDSLWLQPTDGGEVVALPVPADERVTGLWWTADGFAWLTRPAGETDRDEITLSRVASGTKTEIIYQGPATGTSEATPEPGDEGTPVAESSPEPLDTPEPDQPPETPIASPVASPIASPSAGTPVPEA
jgi:dipeptidyl aminopeptidase/acylaminoacyl peptidase